MRIKFLFVIVCLSLFFGCVETQKVDTLENRVAAIEIENSRQLAKQKANAIGPKIEQDLKTLEKKFEQRNSISRQEYAELQDNIQTFKKQFQLLEGLIEEINHRLEKYDSEEKEVYEKQLEQLDQAISKNYEKVIRLEKYMGFEPVLENKPQTDQATVGDAEGNKEQELYTLAKKMFDDGDKENARIQFENFINKYPDSDNADNARFWIADSYYSEKWFEKAILEYQEVLEKYPESNKSAAARLKQGYAFAELGENANARLILQELVKKFPGSNEAQYAQKKLKILK